jgi:glycosyltransferase involved in cell wall biosynthesis
MAKEMAVVAFDCPTGPAEIITDGRDGLLVPPQDVPGLSAALLRVVVDDDLRRRLGAAGAETARRYGLEAVGARWEALLESHGAEGRPQAVR